MRQADIYFSTLVIQRYRSETFGEYNVHEPESLPDVLRKRFTPDVQVIEGDSKELYVNHRVVGDLHYYMVSNSTNKSDKLHSNCGKRVV